MGRGGLGIYIHNKLTYNQICNLTFPKEKLLLYDCLFLQIENEKGDQILIGSIYRTPGPIDNFIEDFEVILNKIRDLKYTQIIITGDFNLNLLNIQTNVSSATFLDTMMSYGLLPNITLPTRVNIQSATLIDNIFTTTHLIANKSGIIESSISDHYPQFISFKNRLKDKTPKPKYIKYRRLNKQNINTFISKLNRTNWDSHGNQDLDTLCNTFTTKFANAYNDSFPIENIKFNKYKHKLNKWMTNGILISMKTKDKLYHSMIKENNECKRLQLLDKYRAYRNLLNGTIRNAKSKYWILKFEESKGNIRQTWNHIRHLLNKHKNKSDFPKLLISKEGNKINGDAAIATSFNEYFTNIGPSLANSMPNLPGRHQYFLSKCKIKTPCGSLLMHPTCSEELIAIVRNLKNKNSCGLDGITPKLLKFSIYSIIDPLINILNTSMSTGVFPTAFKQAKVIPIHKKHDTKQMTNYRPISLLSTFSKILETIVQKRLYSFMIKHDMFYSSQYGFKKGSSTEHAVIELQNKISTNLNNRLLTAGIFLDLSKAFDTLDHTTLIHKLEFYGIRGIALKWFKSYLSNRNQVVQIGNIISSPLQLQTGVPQGSNLGPLLFIIYINDMHSCINSGHTIHFADDTCLLYTSNSIRGLQNQLNKELGQINDWLVSNKLSLNVHKSKCILFHSKYKPIQQATLNVVIDNSSVEVVKSTNFLGIQIDEQLDWKRHITLCSNKIVKVVYTLKSLKNVIPHSILLAIYVSLIQSTLNYGILSWYSPSGNINRLKVLQKKKQ